MVYKARRFNLNTTHTNIWDCQRFHARPGGLKSGVHRLCEPVADQVLGDDYGPKGATDTAQLDFQQPNQRRP